MIPSEFAIPIVGTLVIILVSIVSRRKRHLEIEGLSRYPKEDLRKIIEQSKYSKNLGEMCRIALLVKSSRELDESIAKLKREGAKNE
jgi:hypothetical protein